MQFPHKMQDCDWKDLDKWDKETSMAKIVVFLFGDGVEELELIAPADLLRRAGCEVRLVSTEPSVMITTRGGFRMEADGLMADEDFSGVDLLVLPGGPGVIALRQREDWKPTLRAYAATGKMLAAICAAPLLLHDAGLLQGRKFTCHFSCHGELSSADRELKVVIDGALVTSQGAGTAIEFGLVLVEAMAGSEVRADIARAIMV
jgi:protein deglycase